VIIFVDIDETICETPDSRNYKESRPIFENIEKVNSLYDKGHTIIYWTARGSGTGLDWKKLTEKQFADWNVKHHELRLGKPFYDLFIDDRNINAETFFKSARCFK